MDDYVLADKLSQTILASPDVPKMSASAESANPYAGKLGDALREVIDKFKAGGGKVPWLQIIKLIPDILLLLQTGGSNWQALLQKVLALFNLTPSPMAPVPAP